MARSDEHPTNDQDVGVQFPPGPATFLHGLSVVILSLLLIQDRQLSVSGKIMYTSTG